MPTDPILNQVHTYRLDPNHSAARLTVVMLTIVTILMGMFFLFPAFFRMMDWTNGPWVLYSIIGGIGLGIAVARAGEWLAVKFWPSGRELTINDEGLMLTSPGVEPTEIEWAQPVEVTAWYFTIHKRRSWVPRGWYVVAMRFQQGTENIFLPYTFMAPDIAESMPGFDDFQYLISEKHATSAVQSDLSMEQADLRLAEDQRYIGGAEMTSRDFSEMVGRVAAYLPNWPA